MNPIIFKDLYCPECWKKKKIHILTRTLDDSNFMTYTVTYVCKNLTRDNHRCNYEFRDRMRYYEPGDLDVAP